ncbi:hypothetical protein INR49_016716 [Caranx melampygus]|nr:hypothetical protein INR49_016716 [Caranx melampygus]
MDPGHRPAPSTQAAVVMTIRESQWLSISWHLQSHYSIIIMTGLCRFIENMLLNFGILPRLDASLSLHFQILLEKRYYRGTHGVIVVYDVTSAESFVNVKRWLHEINQNCDDVCRILVGNKNDDPNSKVVETTDAQKFAEQMGINLFETSAKENINVEEMFNCITELVLRAKKEVLAKQQQQQQNDVVKLTRNSKRKKKCC